MDLVVEQVEAEVRLRLRLEIKLPLKAPDRLGCCQAHRQSPILVFVESTPEARVLPSAGITRPQRYHNPVRPPPEPPPEATLRPRPSSQAGLPRYPDFPFRHAVPRIPTAQDGCARRLLPRLHGLPRFPGGSASVSSLSRPAQASLTLRPNCSIAQGDLCHEASARSVAQPSRSSATSATDNSLGGTFLHW